MQFVAKDLKFFLHSMKSNSIKQMSLKSNELEITINTNKTDSYVISQKPKKSNINLFNKKLKTKEIIKNNTHNKSKIKVTTHRDPNESKVYSTIISPMVGTFYQSPAPNESPFIKTGDYVDKKQIVCIIEAMKLMNEIEAEVTGEIVDILVNDGDIVDCGQALMKVEIK